MFERRVLMMALVCDRERAMQGLFKALGKSRHSHPLWPPAIMIVVGRSGNNNIRHIVTYDRGERSVPLCDYATPPHAIPKDEFQDRSKNRSKVKSKESPKTTPGTTRKPTHR